MWRTAFTTLKGEIGLKVRIEITSYLRDLIGSKEIIIDIGEDHTTVKELLRLFAHKYKKEVKKRIFTEDGEVLRNIFVFVNNNLIPWFRLDETMVHDGDSVSTLPAVAGG